MDTPPPLSNTGRYQEKNRNSTALLTACFLAVFIACCFCFCKTDRSRPAPPKYLNLEDSVGYTGMATCRTCHNNVHETFIKTGMGRSFGHATPERSDAVFGPGALVYDTLNDFYYFPYFDKKDRLKVLEFRLENGDTVHQRTETVSYIVGSGQHTNSHIISINGYLYQAPVTWYAQQQRWDMAPGFRQNNSRFGRWLTDECITCHNHYPTLVPGSMNRFADMPTGIECERCHGPGELHVAEKRAGNIVDTARAIDYTIVNPGKLPRSLQMDICQRCHLQGVAVTAPGKTFFDFRPGMKLSDVMNVFLPRYTDSHERFIMASQADRLRLSKCFKKAPSLTCLSCHDPHRSVETTPRDRFNAACRSCHAPPRQPAKDPGPNIKCSAPPAERASNGDDCAACHMPKSGSTDIPHVLITDHFIAVRPTANAAQPAAGRKEEKFLGLEILTKENPAPLDMARGYLATFDKYTPSPLMLDSAAYYLGKSVAGDEGRLPVLIHYLYAKKDFGKIIEELSKPAALPSLDAWTAYRAGEAFLQNNDFQNALKYFSEAEKELPLHLDFLEKKGVALLSLKRLKEAKTVFEKVLSLNPKRPVALCNLGFAHVLTGNLVAGEKLYDKAIALDPDYAQALVNKAALLALQKKKDEARGLLLKVLKKDPANRQAMEGLKHL